MKINESMSSDKCRICHSVSLLSSIFSVLDSDKISTKIMSIAKVQIYPNDGLPNKICSRCKKSLKKCLSFIKQCEHSDSKLRLSLDDSIQDSNEVCNLENHLNTEENIGGIPNTEYNIVQYELSIVETSDSNLDKPRCKNEGDGAKFLNYHHKKKTAQKEQCFTCGKVMSSRFRLVTHLRTHTGEKPFSCTHCNKKFSLAQNLKIHIRTHSGDKPLTCTECGSSFAQPAGLIAHKRKHTGETPYNCSLCPRSFRTAGHLQYHLRCHKDERNFECDTCNRTFITRSDLKQHIIIHTGEKPHVCCVCGFRLGRASHLKRHMAVHSRGKTYPCELCSLKFVRKLDLEEHNKKHEAKRKEDNSGGVS